MTVTPLSHPEAARHFAAEHRLREKALCFVVRQRAGTETELLVLEQPGVPGAGLQVPAGGVEPGETPEGAAARELTEETGLRLSPTAHLKSYFWEAQLPHRLTRQVCHAFLFRAPPGTPDTWEREADGERFAFRWRPVSSLALSWEMDAALPELLRHLAAANTSLPPLQGRPLPLPEARAIAARDGLRERVLAYITRAGAHEHELLVFEHTPDYPDAGIQVPAGGMEPGETPGEAALREAWEETGLRLSDPAYLTSWLWQRGDVRQVWHSFHLSAPAATPDAWLHRVTGGEDDAGLTFLCRFTPLSAPDLIPDSGYDAALPDLARHLQATPTGEPA